MEAAEKHWYQKTCLRDPRNCKQRRQENKPCVNPVCDCLLFERQQEDARSYTES